MEPDSNILSVAEYLRLVNTRLSSVQAKILGEVTTFTVAASGHVYFTVKDQAEQAVIDCIIWRDVHQALGLELEIGQEVLLSGSARIYPARGTFSVVVTNIQLHGEGQLREAYEKLKKKLSKEGLFAPERKRQIPDYIQNIGVITSKSGAVIGDFQSNLGKFGFHTSLLDTRVEGQEAVLGLLAAIRQFKKMAKNLDVLVIIRGGGSLESFLPFNNEQIIREITNFPIPIITGLGHERDEPLLSLASDFNTATPTEAANLIAKSWIVAEHRLTTVQQQVANAWTTLTHRIETSLNKSSNTIRMTMSYALATQEDNLGDAGVAIQEGFESHLRSLRNTLQTAQYTIRESSHKISRNFQGLQRTVQLQLANILAYTHRTRGEVIASGRTLKRIMIKEMLSSQAKLIDRYDEIIRLHHPDRNLEIGYSIVSSGGKVIKSIKKLSVGEPLAIQLIDGSVDSTIDKINPRKNYGTN